jgi:cysteine desulfurase
MFGGGHERNLRPGTLNLPGVVGLGEAARLVRADQGTDAQKQEGLRALLLQRLMEISPVQVIDNGAGSPRLPQTLNLRFEGVRSAAMLRLLSRNLAVSTGSACATTSVEPSHVLLAQGLSRQAISESLRISFGRQTTRVEIEEAAELLLVAVRSVVAVGDAEMPLIADGGEKEERDTRVTTARS